MDQPKFTYGEAVSHGWEMTKKYWFSIAVLTLFFLLFEGIKWPLEYFAGSRVMEKKDVRWVCRDRTQADIFYQHLKNAGYISQYGMVRESVQKLERPEDLVLPEDLKTERHKIYNFMLRYQYRLPFPKAVYFVLSLILWAIGMVMAVGWVKVSLMLMRDKEPDISELFTNWRFAIPYLLASLCFALVVLGGFLLLIIPGLIFVIMFGMYYYLIVDKGLGPVASLKRSRVITKGSRWRLAVFGAILCLLNIAGFLCLIIGVFVTGWISVIASAYVYDRLEHADETGSAHNLSSQPSGMF
jgi:hypothetical protein